MSSLYAKALSSILIIPLIALTACKHPENDYKTPKKTPTRAAQGAVVGAVVTAATNSNIVTGVIAGAAAGGLMGVHEDSRTGIAKRLGQQGIRTIQHGNNLTLVLPSDYFFNPREQLSEIASPTLKTSSFLTLKDVAAFLKASPHREVSIEAHTDSIGSDEFNQRLSKHQAEKLLAYFWTHHVDFHRMQAIGFGKTQPIASNRHAAGNKVNRRIEIHMRYEPKSSTKA